MKLWLKFLGGKKPTDCCEVLIITVYLAKWHDAYQMLFSIFICHFNYDMYWSHSKTSLNKSQCLEIHYIEIQCWVEQVTPRSSLLFFLRMCWKWTTGTFETHFTFHLWRLILYLDVSVTELEYISLHTVIWIGPPGLFWSKGMTDPVSFLLLVLIMYVDWTAAIVLFHLSSFKCCLWDLIGTGKGWDILNQTLISLKVGRFWCFAHRRRALTNKFVFKAVRNIILNPILIYLTFFLKV